MSKIDITKLSPCPWCKTNEHLRAGHIRSMILGVECKKCKCIGPQWGYSRICDEDGCLLPEYEKRVKSKKDVDLLDKLDAYLLDHAIKDWNRLGKVEIKYAIRHKASKNRNS